MSTCCVGVLDSLLGAYEVVQLSDFIAWLLSWSTQEQACISDFMASEALWMLPAGAGRGGERGGVECCSESAGLFTALRPPAVPERPRGLTSDSAASGSVTSGNDWKGWQVKLDGAGQSG